MQAAKVLATAATILGILGAAGRAWAVTTPGGLNAAIQSGDDAQINLNWTDVGDEIGYYVYRVKSTPLTAGTVSSGTADGAVSWVGAANAYDGNYATNSYTNGGANWSSDDWVQIDLPQPAYIGTVGVVQTRQPDSVNWFRNDYQVDINGGTVSSGAFGSIASARNAYYAVYDGTPVSATSVRVALQGGATDSRSAITEIDLWEYERIATLGANTTNWQDPGRNVGQSYAYYVTAFDGVDESGLSNLTTIKAGDRDDSNTGDTTAPVASQPWRNGSFYSAVQPGEADGLHAKVTVPDAPQNLAGQRTAITFDASPTETGSGDIRRYVVFRGVGGDDPQAVQTAASLVSKRVMPGQDAVLDGDPTTSGLRAYNNYSESDDIIDFGDGNMYAITRIVIHQQDGGAQQHHYRAVTVEAEGGYNTDPIDLNSPGPYTTTLFSTSDGSGFATFGLTPTVGGELPDSWIVGDHVVLHLSEGENSVDHGEYEVYGIPISFIDYVDATGAPTYSYLDGTAVLGETYSYFVMAEDFAGNLSLASFSDVRIIPEPATFGLLALAGLILARRRRAGRAVGRLATLACCTLVLALVVPAQAALYRSFQNFDGVTGPDGAPTSTGPVAASGIFSTSGNYASQVGMGKPYSQGDTSGHNDNYGNWDGTGTFSDYTMVFSGFGEWPATPDSSNLLAGWRVNGLRDDNGTPGVPGDDFRTDANIGLGAAAVYNTQIPSATPALSMNFYVRTTDLGTALRTQAPHGTGQLYYLHDNSDGLGNGSDANIAWDWFQAGRHAGAYGDNITVTPRPDVTVSTSDIEMDYATTTHNLALGNTGGQALTNSILTGVAVLYNDTDGAFSIENSLGNSLGSGTGAEILQIAQGVTLANGLVINQVVPGVHSATIDLYLNDPDGGDTVITLNLSSTVPEPASGIVLLLGTLLLRRRRS